MLPTDQAEAIAESLSCQQDGTARDEPKHHVELSFHSRSNLKTSHSHTTFEQSRLRFDNDPTSQAINLGSTSSNLHGEETHDTHSSLVEKLNPESDELVRKRSANVAQGSRGWDLETPLQVSESGRMLTKRRKLSQDDTDSDSQQEDDVLSDDDVEDLSTRLLDILKLNKIGLEVFGGSHNYIPDKDRKELITEDTIRRTLGDATPELISYIHNDASKTFAIVCIVLTDREQRTQAMESFHQYRFKDRNLPVPDIDINSCGKSGRGKKFPKRGSSLDTAPSLKRRRTCDPKHEEVYDCFHQPCWTQNNYYYFRQLQKALVLQRFNTKEFQHGEIDEDRVLPFLLRDDVESIRSGFSVVYPATMLADYLDDEENLLKVDDLKNINVAIKVLSPDSKNRYDLKTEWLRESVAHEELNGLDQHLIRALASFRYKKSFCLLIEWADGGSLDSLCRENSTPPLAEQGPAGVLEILEQLVGLASALRAMHNKHDASAGSLISPPMDTSRRLRPFVYRNLQESRERPWHTPSVSTNSDTPMIKLIQPDDEGFGPGPTVMIDPPPSDQIRLNPSSKREFENWRHGDIKPPNILIFKFGNPWPWMFKLADLGRAKQRSGVTEYQIIPEIDGWRSEAHEAPDIYIDPSASMSRLYDLWSMGTVIFNIIVWVLYGNQQLQNFTNTSEIHTGSRQGSSYWTRIGQKREAKVSDLARKWIRHIMNDVECKRPTGSAIGDLMKLVRDELLVVQLPATNSRDTANAVPGQRSSAARLHIRLIDILERAKKEPRYLSTGNDRSGQLPPPSGPMAVLPTDHEGSDSETLLPPSTGRGRGLNTSQQNTYTHGLEDTWSYESDEEFSCPIAESQADLFPGEEDSVCSLCQMLEPGSVEPLTRMASDRDAQSCLMCEIIRRRAGVLGLSSAKPFAVFRSGGSYIVSGKGLSDNDPAIGRPLLRICREIGTDSSNLDLLNSTGIPVGLPLLPQHGDPVYTDILRAWLDDCDLKHEGCSPTLSGFVPKRLLNVSLESPRVSKVQETSGFPENQNPRYLALSHPWGPESSTNKHFKSTKDNIHLRMKRISDHELPNTFKNAVQIARKLQVKYIWIDSICILQENESKTDPGDFEEESKSMEKIYASAYCVLAASSAEGMNSGFLRDRHQEAVKISGSERTGQSSTYICDATDDFQADVLGGPLNKRGWVLQERALARRTIYFTNNQTYFECGQGVRCETLSKIVNKKVRFLGDSNFPSYATGVEGGGRGAQEFLFKQLYQDYSKLGFSLQADKPFGISALEQRLTRAFGHTSGAGMFSKFWGRSLLWKRDHARTAILRRISFSGRVKAPPSWSWMAYEGGITYLQPPDGNTRWNDTVLLRLTGTPNVSWLNASEPLKLSASLKVFIDRENDKDGAYDLTYDDDIEAKDRKKRCVIIGSIRNEGQAEQGEYYVLVVSPITAPSGETAWERIGAGSLDGSFIQDIDKESLPVDII